jgi:repressor LexA
MYQLTPRQKEILQLLKEHAARDHAPTLDELCQAMGLSSRGSLHKHIQALALAGLVEHGHASRGVHLSTRAREEADTLPVLGRIAAGKPLEALTDEARLAVPPSLRGKGECYVLAVRGESMRDEGILDGDWVIVEPREQARNGELAVVLIDEGEVTLKRIEQRPGQIILHSANPTFAAMRYAPERIRIQGVVVAQMRRY